MLWHEVLLGKLTVLSLIGCYAALRLHKAIDSYIKGYGEELGKIRATDEKLKQILNNLSHTVTITEQIKSEVDKKKNFSNVWATEFFTVLNEVSNFKNEFVNTYTNLWVAEINGYINEPKGIELQENLIEVVIKSYVLEIKLKSYTCFLDDHLSDELIESSTRLFSLTRKIITHGGRSTSTSINADDLISMLSAQNLAALEAHRYVILRDE